MYTLQVGKRNFFTQIKPKCLNLVSFKYLSNYITRVVYNLNFIVFFKA